MGEGSIYQLYVRLLDVEPAIWRRLLVRSDTPLDQLHQVLQLSLGWTDSHLHEFTAAGRTLGEPDPDDDDPPEDEASVTVAEVLERKGDSISYLYDYGDGWEHSIVLEKTHEPDPEATYPACIAGERSGPPEDCGGVDGYAAFLEAIGDPEHEEHESMLEWIGGEFDPESFDIDWVNELLEAIGRVEWIGALFELPEGLLENAPQRPWVVAWLDASEAVVIDHAVVSHDSRYELAMSLLDRALEEASSGGLRVPDRVRTDDVELASAVEARHGEVLEVLQDEIPEAEEVRKDLVEHIAESWKIVQSLGSYLAGEVEPAQVAQLFRAAARLYRASPWEKIRGRISIEVNAPELGLDGALMSLGGDPGENPGIYIVESPGDQAYLLEPLSSTIKDDDVGPLGPLRVLFFERGADVPAKMRREISDHSFEVVDAHAYPKLLLIGSDGTPFAPDARELSLVVACTMAMAELVETHSQELDDRSDVSILLEVDTGPSRIQLSLRAPHPALEHD